MHTGICKGYQWKCPESILHLAFSRGLGSGAQGQGRASAAKGGPHPASDRQAVLQGGRDCRPSTALEHCLQLSLSLALPELWCSPVLPGPAEPGPTSGLTSWPGLAQPHPRGPAGPSQGCV